MIDSTPPQNEYVPVTDANIFSPALLSGIVLAGGHSQRLRIASSKPLLSLGGKLMLARVADTLKTLCHETILVVRPDQEDDVPDLGLALGMHVVTDTEGYSGPLAAMCAGLQSAVTPLAFVVGTDHPFLSRGLIVEMTRQAYGTSQGRIADGVPTAAVVPRYGARNNPLHAVYPVSEWRILTEQALHQGIRSPNALLENAMDSFDAAVHIMMPDEIEKTDPSLLSLLDIDTLEDLGIAKRIIEDQRHKVRADLRSHGI